MKRSFFVASLILALTTAPLAASAGSFTYHGVLQDAGRPASGTYDIELTLYSASDGGKVVAGPLTMYKVDVHDGSFSTAAAFPTLADVPQQAWLGVRVRGVGDSDFSALGARAPVGADAVASATCPGAWSLSGNAGNPPGSYLGTADNQPLLLQSATGVAINGMPKNSNTELSIFSPNYPNLFLGTTGKAGGILISQDPASTATANDAALAIDEYDGGTGQSRKMYVSSAGVTVYGNEAAVGTQTINGAPKDSGTELSVYPTSGGFDYSNIYLGTKGAGGIQVSVGDESSSTSNDASFYVDQYDGNLRARRFMIARNGAVGINSTPDAGVALSIMKPGGPDGSAPDGTTPLITQMAGWQIIAPLSGSSGADLQFQYVSTSAPALSIINTDSIEVAQDIYNGSDVHAGRDIYAQGNIIIGGSAYKPGGGSWSNSSDRRIKQDIAPIGNAIDTLLKLNPVSFRYTPEYRALEGGLPDTPYLGFIAQEFRDVFPDAVTSTGKRVPGAPEDAAPILALDSSPALITTVASVQELAMQSQDDANRLRILEAENASLRAQVDREQRALEAVIARLTALEQIREN